ncbi:Asp-tRNA(Asn)/Glu-tRNA(Gln) amidotransferase subunit GatA [Mobilicoccus pelagius]|uniref:Glutamyl-tRNA(Gln) amidotransferase subunit A n=1 Tax=Mobilicoccus pelagius NBRC 104925 TaxID=1089455 RepID=H5UNJ0_9MICO|nr:Asp-tRNA(Asn)/Glu-tRNA(Gln) amidotransferase subunit GatA [Mobilicoccus pelagius]GAB47298.1 aspartyl/glutamyl-tRNA(Asn/Gln) amidotransferase subunit A [Mobilicoccus pelagius NBRC 104925]
MPPTLDTPEALTHASAADLAAALADGTITSVDLTRAHLARIEATEPAVHAYLAVDADGALATAAEVDAARAAGETLPPLAGVPVAVKDVACTKGLVTTAGSTILDGWVPPYDADVVERLRAARMPILGKTNMDEFAMGSSTEHSAYGDTHNPWALDRVPGGSGGGSAASLAAFSAPLAVGSDTGGSIRQPAAFTGTVGCKPTYGAVSRYGVIALASSLDQIGPCGRTVLDTALLHEVLAGHDPRDSTSIDAPVPPVVEAARRGDVAGMRIGVVRDLLGEGLAEGVRARFDESLQHLREAGAEIVEIDCPNFAHAVAAYYLILPAEASSNLARYDAMRYGVRVDAGGAERTMAASRAAGFGPEVKRRIILGTYALSSGYYDAWYGQAQKVRTLIARDFEAAFERVDVLVSPTAPTTAFPLGTEQGDPLAMYLSDITTIPANLAGLPGLSLPNGLAEDGLPSGFQVYAPAMADDRLYAVGAALEARLHAQWGGGILDEIPALPETTTTSEATR